MNLDGDTAWAATVPGEKITMEGFQYFIEARDVKGRPVPLVGTGYSPRRVEVFEEARPAPSEEGRSRANTSFEWVDFYNGHARQDYFWKIEADYAYHLRLWKFFEAFRMGFGIYQGAGGPTRFIEELAKTGGEPTSIAITYAYFEPEIRLHRLFSIMPRLLIGGIQEKVVPGMESRHAGDGIFGFQTYMRIGEADRTNLLLGISFTEELGMEALIKMSISILDRFPVGVSAAATNMPLNDDYAARLLLHAGWLDLDWMSVYGTFGVNLRNIHHVGMSGGVELSFLW